MRSAKVLQQNGRFCGFFFKMCGSRVYKRDGVKDIKTYRAAPTGSRGNGKINTSAGRLQDGKTTQVPEDRIQKKAVRPFDLTAFFISDCFSTIPARQRPTTLQ